MRHRVYGFQLGRNIDERNRLFKGLVSSLFTYGTITTSETKAKSIKGMVDRIITLAKSKNKEHKLQSFLTDKDLRDRLIKEILPSLKNRTSGYTSILKVGTRMGDQTMMVRMSLIGAEQLKTIEKELRVKSQESSKKPVKTAVKKVTRITKSKQQLKRSKTGGKKS